MKLIIFFFFSFLLYASEIKIALSANVNFAFKELINDFNKIHKDIKIVPVIGSSGKLTSQIENGAPFDIFLSANMKYPEYLYKKKLTYTKPVEYAKGKLVFFSTKYKNLKDNLKIAIANPDVAPYGKRAMEVIKKLKLKIKIINAPSVAMAYYYALKFCDGAFLPYSLVKGKKGYIKLIDSKLYSPIRQGMVLLKPKKAAKEFFVYLLSLRAIKILKKYGYDD
jgi:molybdate transport system substrate-binding protein